MGTGHCGGGGKDTSLSWEEGMGVMLYRTWCVEEGKCRSRGASRAMEDVRGMAWAQQSGSRRPEWEVGRRLRDSTGVREPCQLLQDKRHTGLFIPEFVII